MDRACSVLEVKVYDPERRTITGMATSPVPDRVGDIVEPLGAKFAKSVPLFLYHDSRLTVGTVAFGQPTKAGIPFTAEFPKIVEAGALRDRVEEALQMVQYKLIAAVSIGFRAIADKMEFLKGGGIRYLESEILELSLVPVPMQSRATIDAIKSFDAATRKELGLPDIQPNDGTSPGASARGQGGGVRPGALPGASGAKPAASSSFSLTRSQKGNDMKTYAEQITALVAKRAEMAARMGAIMQKTADEGRSSDEAEATEFDELKAQVTKADDDLVRLRDMEKLMVSQATEVTPAKAATSAGASEARGYITTKSNLPKGTLFTRYAMAMARTKGNHFEAAQYVKERFTDTPELVNIIKAAADIGTTTDSDWASKLVDYTNMANEFVDLLRPETILGKFGQNGIPALHRVPFNIRMVTQTGGGTYGWVGEGAAKPVGQLSLDEITMKWAKAAGIIVITEELAKFSTPSAEAIVRQDMIKGMAQFSDLQFIDPQVFAVADVSPASVTNLVTDTPASGTTVTAFNADLVSMIGKMTATNLSPTTGVFIMSSQQALRLSLSQNALGQPAYPGVTMKGGYLAGFPVIVSDAVPNTSDGSMIVFLNADDIFFADDGPVTIDASREASLQMNTTPDNPTTASTVLVSLWQRNLIAMRAERYMNWKKRRAQAVQYISGAAYV